MSQPIIEVTNLSKKYRLGQRRRHDTLRDELASAAKVGLDVLQGKNDNHLEAGEFWALKDINFTVNEGEVLGIIGKNGSGKSTLLKILSRITSPTDGEAHIRGRVASLLEVGTGFSPELTGRENIFLNGAILGMTQKEIKKKFDEIVAFSEIEKFIDTPVKHYSSGMYVRLAFAVAAHLESEILIVDEVLSVGDLEFQKKCLGKIGQVTAEGRTVLFVSHNIDAIQKLCDRAILLCQGQIIAASDQVDNIINVYVRSNLATNINLKNKEIARKGNGFARFVEVGITDLKDNKLVNVCEGEPFKIKLILKVIQSIEISILSITFIDPNNRDLLTTFAADSLDLHSLYKGKRTFSIFIDPNPFRSGTVKIRLACFGKNMVEYDHVLDAYTFLVIDTKNKGRLLPYRPGVINLPYKWES